jgi:O-acetyl-ADP-ribose deacetylase
MPSDTYQVGKAKVRLVKGDITQMETEAVVNAANSTLMGGGGVDGAIHLKGGSQILEECRKIRQTKYLKGCPTGQAVMTSGGKLKAHKVIHTVGPVWHGGTHGEPELLKKSYLNSLRLAVMNGLLAVAFPSINTGAYGFPVDLASRIALKAVKESLEDEDGLVEVVLVLFSEGDLQVYRLAADETFR